jgi:hypothetical protein
VLDFAAVLGGDFVSVLNTASLSITSGGETITRSGQFGSGDSELSFDVVVKTGEATFAVDVMSTNNTLLYHGSTTQTIEQDGFAVSITPQAVSGVTVIAPHRPAYSVFDNGQIRTYTAPMRVRNAGSASLTWRLDSVVTKPAGVTIFCGDEFENNCLLSHPLAPGTRELAITVGFSMPSSVIFAPLVTLRFISSVGDVTTRP